jgi:hypothetical protein
LFPSDSLSRSFAAEVSVDTLHVAWQVRGQPGEMRHPRTVAFGADGRVYVGDTERNAIFVLSPDGEVEVPIRTEHFSFPYIAGWRGDSLLVFNPQEHRVDFVVAGVVVRSISTPEEMPGPGALQYAAASDDALFIKAIDPDLGGFLAQLGDRGEVTRRDTLGAPYLRHVGFLRIWGDSLLSLSGYRPVATVWHESEPADTLAFLGFDSPMLARSRAYALGAVAQAPLLSASAAPAGDYLFVLNLRPGWLRIDVFDRAGRLVRVLSDGDPRLDRQFYPVDIAARAVSGTAYELAVLTARPEPGVAVYRWNRPLVP